jgi:proline iminopeptidase
MRMPMVAGLAALLALSLSGCGGGMYKPGSAAKKEVRAEGSLAGPEGKLVVDGKVELYWFARGEGSPVLMVHGGPGYPFKAAWKGLEPLTARHRFIYYHQRGCGKSTRPVDGLEAGNFYESMLALDGELGMAVQLRDIEAFRKASGAERISLVGHSYGGLLAALYAAEYPDRVDALVLVAPAEVARMPMKKSSGLYGSVADKLPPQRRKEFAAFMKRFFDYKARSSRRASAKSGSSITSSSAISPRPSRRSSRARGATAPRK